MATDYKMVALSAPSVWDYNYYLYFLFSVMLYVLGVVTAVWCHSGALLCPSQSEL